MGSIAYIWRMALNQCEFGETHRRTTGILTNIALQDKRLHRGWPRLCQRPDDTFEYLSPLLKNCSCQQAHQLVRPRLRGSSWNAAPLKTFLLTILRRALHRDLLTGKGSDGKVAMCASLNSKGYVPNAFGDVDKSCLCKPPLFSVESEARAVSTEQHPDL